MATASVVLIAMNKPAIRLVEDWNRGVRPLGATRRTSNAPSRRALILSVLIHILGLPLALLAFLRTVAPPEPPLPRLVPRVLQPPGEEAARPRPGAPGHRPDAA